MKKITLTRILTADRSSIYTKRKHYCISVGNGVSARFSNLEKAEAFLTKLNEELNFNLSVMNMILVEIFTNYRRLWFYLNNLPEYSAHERRITEAFQDIDRYFNIMVTRSHFENGNYFVFQNFRRCLAAMDEILSVLKKYELQRTAYAEYRMLKALSERIDIVRSEINQLGVGEGNIKVPDGPGTMG